MEALRPLTHCERLRELRVTMSPLTKVIAMEQSVDWSTATKLQENDFCLPGRSPNAALDDPPPPSVSSSGAAGAAGGGGGGGPLLQRYHHKILSLFPQLTLLDNVAVAWDPLQDEAALAAMTSSPFGKGHDRAMNRTTNSSSLSTTAAAAVGGLEQLRLLANMPLQSPPPRPGPRSTAVAAGISPLHPSALSSPYNQAKQSSLSASSTSLHHEEAGTAAAARSATASAPSLSTTPQAKTAHADPHTQSKKPPLRVKRVHRSVNTEPMAATAADPSSGSFPPLVPPATAGNASRKLQHAFDQDQAEEKGNDDDDDDVAFDNHHRERSPEEVIVYPSYSPQHTYHHAVQGDPADNPIVVASATRSTQTPTHAATQTASGKTKRVPSVTPSAAVAAASGGVERTTIIAESIDPVRTTTVSGSSGLVAGTPPQQPPQPMVVAERARPDAAAILQQEHQHQISFLKRELSLQHTQSLELQSELQLTVERLTQSDQRCTVLENEVANQTKLRHDADRRRRAAEQERKLILQREQHLAERLDQATHQLAQAQEQHRTVKEQLERMSLELKGLQSDASHRQRMWLSHQQQWHGRWSDITTVRQEGFVELMLEERRHFLRCLHNARQEMMMRVVEQQRRSHEVQRQLSYQFAEWMMAAKEGLAHSQYCDWVLQVVVPRKLALQQQSLRAVWEQHVSTQWAQRQASWTVAIQQQVQHDLEVRRRERLRDAAVGCSDGEGFGPTEQQQQLIQALLTVTNHHHHHEPLHAVAAAVPPSVQSAVRLLGEVLHRSALFCELHHRMQSATTEHSSSVARLRCEHCQAVQNELDERTFVANDALHQLHSLREIFSALQQQHNQLLQTVLRSSGHDPQSLHTTTQPSGKQPLPLPSLPPTAPSAATSPSSSSSPPVSLEEAERAIHNLKHSLQLADIELKEMEREAFEKLDQKRAVIAEQREQLDQLEEEKQTLEATNKSLQQQVHRYEQQEEEWIREMETVRAAHDQQLKILQQQVATPPPPHADPKLLLSVVAQLRSQLAVVDNLQRTQQGEVQELRVEVERLRAQADSSAGALLITQRERDEAREKLGAIQRAMSGS